MGDAIRTKTIEVIVQENGLIRRADTGLLIGHLYDQVSFETLTWKAEETEG